MSDRTDAPSKSLGRSTTSAIVRLIPAVLGIALLARVNLPVPGSPVPQSGQTLAVLVVGVVLGSRGATLALGAYLLAGGVGLPVFADGEAGWAHLVGPTAGYLVGFVVAAALIGWLAGRGRLGRLLPALLAMAAGHVIILGLGWARLGSQLGFEMAYQQGVSPFITGGAAKSLIAAIVAVGVAKWRCSAA